MFIRKFGFISLLISLILFPITVEAQTATSAILTPPETANFPIIQTYLEAYNEQGDFIHDLDEGDITIIEDGKNISILEIDKLKTGAQFVVALNLGPTFAIRDSNGISRYQTIQSALSSWAAEHEETLDDLSFLTNDGSENTHLDDAQKWLIGFEGYESDPRVAVPSLDVLVRAINVASDPVPRIGMGRAVLLLTPPPDRAGTASLQSIISLAKQERVHVYIWMVSSPAYFSSDGAQQLAELANQTGGRFFTFSGTEVIPNINNDLENLRYVYSIQYESRIRNSEPHRISAKITANGLSINSDHQDFEFEVLPPNPIFLSPPQQIFRANRSALNETLSEEPEYTPKEQVLKILLEFPDGRPRAIQRTTLYMDGKIVDENTSAPFDSFTWNLIDYKTSGLHTLQAEVLDSYGLSNISIETPIQITVQQTPQSVIVTLAKNAPIIAGAAVATAGGILVLVLIIGRRIQPKTFGRRIKKKEREQRKDPVTQPVTITSKPSGRRITSWINRFSWPQRESAAIKPTAYLEPVENNRFEPTQTLIAITTNEITFGKDPTLATTAFNDSSVDNLHARLKINSGEEIKIFDEGSIAGTWVNFTPVPTEGTILSHGDIIHIGRVMLRFKLTDKNKIPKPIIIPQELRS